SHHSSLQSRATQHLHPFPTRRSSDLIDGDTLYLVTVKELYRSSIDAEGGVGELQLLLNDLPDGGQHPNRTIQVGPDGMLYLSVRSEEHTSELQSRENLVCRLLLEKKN